MYDVGQAAALEYAPDVDGLADPGEVVWAWVPYEEDPRRGKDRPLVVVGRAGRRLVAMMLSSQSEHAGQPEWLELGRGAWDGDGRTSYLRLDRVFVLDEHDIRREAAALDADRFAQVAAALHRTYGWSGP